MLETPQLLQADPQETAVIRFTIPRADMATVFGPGVQELLGVVSAQGVGPAGPVYAYHFQIAPGVFDFELGVAVHRSVTPMGRVHPGALPGAKVARAVYQGPYEGLGAAWGSFEKWMKEAGLRPARSLWEVYAAGPQTSPDTAQWRTELWRPLVE